MCGMRSVLPLHPALRSTAVDPRLMKRIRSPVLPVTWTCEMVRPLANSSVVHSITSPWLAVATYCVVVHKAGRPRASSMQASDTAMAVPP